MSAGIGSGTFESYNNAPIAFYSAAVDAGERTEYSDQEEPGVSAVYTYEQGGAQVTKTCHFCRRSGKTGFVRYGRLNRYYEEDASATHYDFTTG